MFTPIDQLTEAEKADTLGSLDAPPEWEATWDIGLVEAGDSYPVKPRWGAWEVAGRWPAAFPLGRDHRVRPWRRASDSRPGHSPPQRSRPVPLARIGTYLRQ